MSYSELSTKKKSKVDYSASSGLTQFLNQLKISFVFTSYQSNLVYFVGQNHQNSLNIHQLGIEKPMGLHFNPKKEILSLAAAYQIYHFKNTLEPYQRIDHLFDACFVPRNIQVTGKLDAHDISIDQQDRTLFINTRFNCLATPSEKYSFIPIWKPDFISTIIDEDRCHLNGLVLDKGIPAYVTAVSRSNTIDGWRDRRADGGIVIDIQENKIICDGLSMPHSPRFHNNQLWILNAGTGELGIIKKINDHQSIFEAKVFCPGFLRGLTFYKNFAFVGLSKPRYQRFEGLALDQRLKDVDSDAWCGIQIIDLNTSTCVAWLRIDGDVSELYDIEIIPGIECPMAITANSNETISLVNFPENWQNNE